MVESPPEIPDRRSYRVSKTAVLSVAAFIVFIFLRPINQYIYFQF
jgi:hypothetical protein